MFRSEDHAQISRGHKRSRDELICQWAKAAGHILDCRDQCSQHRCRNCGIVIPVRRNLALLEAVLHMRCVCNVALAGSNIRLTPISDSSEQHGSGSSSSHMYMSGKVVVHGSHTMATHAGLGLHFCTACGSHGSLRSNYLRKPCMKLLRPSGRQALRLIGLGKKTSFHLEPICSGMALGLINLHLERVDMVLLSVVG